MEEKKKFLRSLQSLQKEDPKKFLEVIQELFICLRCGECCFAWEVRMPDGRRKPERENCKYLIPRKIKGNKWQEATCIIHDTPQYPQECKQAALGIGFCSMGAAIWKHLKEQNPEVELPELAEKAIELYYSQGK